MINMALTVLCYGIVIAIIWLLVGDEEIGLPSHFAEYTIMELYFGVYFGVYFIPVLSVSVLFTIIFLFLDKQCCFSRSQRCFCSSCCGPPCYEFRYEYVDTEMDRNYFEEIEN